MREERFLERARGSDQFVQFFATSAADRFIASQGHKDVGVVQNPHGHFRVSGWKSLPFGAVSTDCDARRGVPGDVRGVHSAPVGVMTIPDLTIAACTGSHAPAAQQGPLLQLVIAPVPGHANTRPGSRTSNRDDPGRRRFGSAVSGPTPARN